MAAAGATAAAAAAAAAAAEAAVGNGGSSGGSSSCSSFKVLTPTGPADETQKRGPEDASHSAFFYPPWVVVVTFGSGTTHTSIHTCARGKLAVSARRGHDGFARAAGGSVWP